MDYSTKNSFSEHLSDRIAALGGVVQHVTNYAVFAYTVICIETTIRWNSIEGVFSIATTGQLIPLMIGVASLLKFTWALRVLIWTKSSVSGLPSTRIIVLLILGELSDILILQESTFVDLKAVALSNFQRLVWESVEG